MNLNKIPEAITKPVKPEVLAELGRFATAIGCDIWITSGFRLGDPGQHGKGLAVDIVVPSWTKGLRALFDEAQKFKFTGIGVYPDWQYEGKTCGGLHLDQREGKAARWLGIGHGKASNKYLKLSEENMKKYGVT